ncbi:MAG: hypothetical protein ABL912_00575 [Novosphingobium sp.]
MKPASLVLALAFTGCVTPTATPQDLFWQALSSHCGKAFAGRLVSNDAPDADMLRQAMTMHVRECSANRIAVPFHVQRADGSWDRSRTWLITRTAGGLRLKHDHRHEDGKADSATLYGGETATPGSAAAQLFPVDAESIALFKSEGRTASITNVWRIEVDRAGAPAARFAYQLTRQPPNARNFRVEFDLTRPSATPPPPWGH